MRMLDAATANRAVKGDEEATEELILAIRDNTLNDLAQYIADATAKGITTVVMHLDKFPARPKAISDAAKAAAMDHVRDLGYEVTHYDDAYVIDWSNPQM